MEKLFIALQAVLPQHSLSRLIGRLAGLEHPAWLKNGLISLFMRSYGISLDEAEKSQKYDYPSFNAFFTRALKVGVRPHGNSRYLHPADGMLSQCGRVDDGQLLQAKGRTYTSQALLAGTEQEAARFDQGTFATVYLAPKDYHRVHMPISGTLKMTRYVPGQLFAVNTTTANGINELYARNERLVCLFDTADGELAIVLVGAMIVAGISTVWGGVETPAPSAIREQHFAPGEQPLLAAGDELGRFFLGSTVVLLTERGDLQWQATAGDEVQVLASLAD
mgnify:CR=1 FL=1